MDKVSLMVIGGGIIGHMVAMRALEFNPHEEIVMIEQDIAGSGASARSAGLHFPLGRSAAVRNMSLRSQRFYEAAVEKSPHLPMAPLRLRIHCRDSKADWLEGILTEGSRPQKIRYDAEPASDVADAISTWAACGAHRTDVAAYIASMRRWLCGRMRFLDGMKVIRIDDPGDCIAVTTNDGSRITSERAVLAPGPWALEPAFKPFIAPTGVRIKKVVAFHVEEDCPEKDEAVDLFVEDDAFLMPRGDGQARLFSYTCTEWDVSPQSISQGVTEANRAEAEAVLRRNVPHFHGRLLGGQFFCDAYSPDRVPIADCVSASGRLVFAGAANGSGYRLAPAIAEDALARFCRQTN